MKITVNIDCTPEEARAFLGMPDVRSLNETLVRTMEERLAKAMVSMDPEALMKAWFPPGVPGWEKFREAFWAGFKGDAPGGKPET